jgi:hypothetical protein
MAKGARNLHEVRNHVHADRMKFDPALAVFYGRFLMTAYKMYESDPGCPTPPIAPIAPLPVGYEFVAWVQMRDFTLFGPGPYTFYGLIACNSSNPNQCVLAIRGTESIIEWLDDFTTISAVQMPDFGGEVGSGFYQIYRTLRVVCPQRGNAQARKILIGSFAEQVADTMTECYSEKIKHPEFVVTGHSLGAALATLYVAENSIAPKRPIPLICTFASPFVGDEAFASKFDKLGIPSWRIVNEPDLVPKAPRYSIIPPLAYQHVRTEYLCNSTASAVQSWACYHYLETYLHMLDRTQPLKDECKLPAGTTRTSPLISTQKEIVLSMPHEAGTTINITIKIE